MISEREAAKVYPQGNTKVIRKGHPDWRSDHPQGRGEKYVYNPTAGMVAQMQRVKAAEVDTSSLETITDTAPLKTRLEIPQGNDLVTVELRENAAGRYWHTCYRQRNGAL